MQDVVWIKGCGSTFDELPSGCLGPWFDLVLKPGRAAEKALAKAFTHPNSQPSAAAWPCHASHTALGAAATTARATTFSATTT